ncbi:hypothetical protein PoB_003826500 [Plakobranchus ocellatus]|uniref:Uncharacterized protein n=1 Tax=Plakobranchus ocellatus TaxID=259542 RepID=A0AAV4AY68_9GAST|nr:hypothetical protein PoB_003826500 [Plakobranchus ocellatus]
MDHGYFTATTKKAWIFHSRDIKPIDHEYFTAATKLLQPHIDCYKRDNDYKSHNLSAHDIAYHNSRQHLQQPRQLIKSQQRLKRRQHRLQQSRQ